MIGIKLEKKKFLKALGFRQEVAIITNCRCPLCAQRIDEEEFRDKVCIKEFESSGLCQGCLDSFFGYKVAW